MPEPAHALRLPDGIQVEVAGDLAGPDLDEALGLLQLVYPGKFDRATWNWKYSRHYLGPPRIALVRRGGRIVGLQPSIRHKIWWHGSEAIAYQLADVLTHPDHRRRGVVPAMVGALSSAAAAEGAACVFTFPNRRSMPGFRRLPGWSHPFSLSLMARLPSRPWAAPSARALDGGSIQSIDSFDAGVDRLDAALSRRFGAATRRDHAYLNWRYCERPGRPYVCLGERDQGGWRAYAIGRTLRRFGIRLGLIVDLLGDPAPLARVVPALERSLAERGARALGALVPAASPAWGLLRRLGYRRLPAWLTGKEFYFVLKSPQPDAGAADDWWLTWGNIDIV